MLKKTHLVVGTATSLCVLQPASIRELLIGTGVAMAGALISDMDSESTKANKYMDKLVPLAALAVIALMALSTFWEQDIWSKLSDGVIMTPKVIACIALFVICAFGKEQPHRSFMHSFLGFLSLYGCVQVICPVATPYFGVAFFSHLAIDLLNKKGLKLFYPWKKGFCLDCCSSSGLVNGWMFKIGLLVSCVAFVGHMVLLVL